MIFRPNTKHLSLFTSVKRGFTLVELLVVVVLIGILSAIATDIFIHVTRAYNKANVIAEIGQNGNLALATMSNEIRNALSVSYTPGQPQGTSIDIVNQDKETIVFRFTPPTPNPTPPPTYLTNGYVTRNGARITDDQAVTGVNVTGCLFNIDSSAQPPVVKITITLTQPVNVPSRIDFQAETTLETTVSLRTY